MVPALGTEDVEGAPKYHGLWKRYIKKKGQLFGISVKQI